MLIRSSLTPVVTSTYFLLTSILECTVPDATHPRMRSGPPKVVTCKFCRSELADRAAKCAACGEWAEGRADYSQEAKALRVVGRVWIILSALAALGWWLVGVAGSGEDEFFPLFGYILAIAILLQGLLVGLAAVVIAEQAPRQPR